MASNRDDFELRAAPEARAGWVELILCTRKLREFAFQFAKNSASAPLSFSQKSARGRRRSHGLQGG